MSLRLSDTIYDRYQESINATILNAEELSETADELVQADFKLGDLDEQVATAVGGTGGNALGRVEHLHDVVADSLMLGHAGFHPAGRLDQDLPQGHDAWKGP